MASRGKKYAYSDRHGHEKQSRVILEGDKAKPLPLEGNDNRPIPKKPNNAPEPKRSTLPSGVLHSLNGAILAAKRVEEFRANK